MTGVLERINIAARILQQNPWIKDMTNSQFKSVDIDQIRREVGAAESEAGLVVQYRETEFEPMSLNGKTFCKVSAILTYYSIDDENMENGLEFPRSAIGYDSLDKGWNKAESMLYKNHYKGLYHIGERADDPDSMSNEEYDLLEVFRFITSYDTQGKPTRAYRDQIMQVVEKALPKIQEEKRKQEEERRKKLRADKAAQVDGFLSGSKKEQPKTEADVTKPENTERTAAWAEAQAEKFRPDIIEFFQENPKCVIISERIEQYGQISDWRAGIVIQCMSDLKAEGLL